MVRQTFHNLQAYVQIRSIWRITIQNVTGSCDQGSEIIEGYPSQILLTFPEEQKYVAEYVQLV